MPKKKKTPDIPENEEQTEWGPIIEEADDLPEADDAFYKEPGPEDLPPRDPMDWPMPPEPTPEDPEFFGEILESHTKAALFVSDFHMSDGGPGDDFCRPHLQRIPGTPLQGGVLPPGPSMAPLFARVLTFAQQRLAAVLGRGAPRADIVLNGDLIDQLELIGRATTLSPKHNAFFGTAAAARAAGHQVFYLRGNHDFVVPPGPWTPGAFYANSALTTFAEHGDRWDPSNWPPGLGNTGSQLVVDFLPLLFGPGAAFLGSLGLADLEVQRIGGVLELAGLDNLRPFAGNAVTAFFARRTVFTRAVARGLLGFAGAAVARFLIDQLAQQIIGPPDDSGGVIGARMRRRGARFTNWLMVQGHTHVPCAIPRVYYNTGTWTPALVAPANVEVVLRAFPFLLVYHQPGRGRVEEYYTLNFPFGQRPQALRRNAASVRALRTGLGYPPC